MDQGSTPPGGSPDRPPEGTPPQGQGQPSQPQPPYAQEPPGPQPDYMPAQQNVPPVAPQQGYPPQGPQGAPPPGYVPPPGYQSTPGSQMPPGYPPQQGYPPQGYPPAGYAEPVKKSGMPAWGWILIVAGVVLLLICGGTFYTLNLLTRQVGNMVSTIGSELGTGDLVAVGTALSFYSELESGNYTSAREMLSSEMKNRFSADDLSSKWDALKGGANGITVGFPTGDRVDDTTIVTQELTGGDGQTYTVKLTLKETDPFTWLIVDADPDLIPSP